MPNLTHCFKVGRGYGLECDITYDYSAGSPGVRYHPDGSGTPPTAPEIELTSVSVAFIFRPAGSRLGGPWFTERGWGKMVDALAIKLLQAELDQGLHFYHVCIEHAEGGG